MRGPVRLVLAAVVVLAVAGGALASDGRYALYVQPPVDPNGGPQWGESEQSTGVLRYENYPDMAEPVWVVAWFGWTQRTVVEDDFPCTESTPEFDLVFYEDWTEVPGEPRCIYADVLATVAPTGWYYGDFELLEFVAVLPSGCNHDGQSGWVSIQGGGDPDCRFVWLSGTGGDARSYVDYSGYGYPEYYDRGLLLYGWSEVAGACCAPDGSCTETLEADCAGVWQGPGTNCDGTECPQPGACCFMDGECVLVFEGLCVQADGSWQGAGTSCDPNPCPQPGACCEPYGYCYETVAVGCYYVWMGPGTGCDPNPCPQPGACCDAYGYCSLAPLDMCYGVWLGEGTSCDPNPCPQPGACCAFDGDCTVVLEVDCVGDWQGPGTGCDPNPCPQPGACCDAYGYCSLTLGDACDGVWLGDGTYCDPNPCPQPGACCAPDGSCSVRPALECEWNWLGDGTYCEPNPCPQPGACCASEGDCTVALEADCAGDWQGPGTGCDPNPCAQPVGACCFEDDTCSVLTQADCANVYGDWRGSAVDCDPNPCVGAVYNVLWWDCNGAPSGHPATLMTDYLDAYAGGTLFHCDYVYSLTPGTLATHLSTHAGYDVIVFDATATTGTFDAADLAAVRTFYFAHPALVLDGTLWIRVYPDADPAWPGPGECIAGFLVNEIHQLAVHGGGLLIGTDHESWQVPANQLVGACVPGAAFTGTTYPSLDGQFNGSDLLNDLQVVPAGCILAHWDSVPSEGVAPTGVFTDVHGRTVTLVSQVDVADDPGGGTRYCYVSTSWEPSGGAVEFDCNENGVLDSVDIAAGTSTDCNDNTIPDECEIYDGSTAPGGPFFCEEGCDPDCNDNGVPDACDIAGETSADHNENGVPDECEGACCRADGSCVVRSQAACAVLGGTWIGAGVSCSPNPCSPPDCNHNGIPDVDDIAGGTSRDVNSNGVPDECEPDCNGNGVPDAWDISTGGSPDCDANGVPDACQADTDGDGRIDACDGCPNDRAKTAPGACGCGQSDADSDGDGTPDCNDGCPSDPAKTAPGACGCGVADTDADGDGVADCLDNCPAAGNPDQADDDGDGVGNVCDDDQSARPEPEGGSAFMRGLIDLVADGSTDAAPPGFQDAVDRLGTVTDGVPGNDLGPSQSGRTSPGEGGDAASAEELEQLAITLGLCPSTSTLVLGATLVGLLVTRRRS